MKLISESNEQSEVLLVGGKGSHLQKLIHWGAPVPPFFVLTTDCFKRFKETGILSPEVEKCFDDFFQHHPEIALRSSMISEDNIDTSFAGMFETLLDVTKGNWKKSLLHIYDSVSSPRVQEYIQKKDLKVDLQMAVVAQALVKVEKSGVIFTRSPVIPTAAVAIDAAFGMGEGVVSGHSDVDHYQLTRTKDLIQIRSQNEKQVLTKKEMEELVDLALKLEIKNGSPSDLEWGYKDGNLYLFQIRPITRTFDPITFFVDTNLSESYPGTVSPFTAEFVKRAYENVFSESAEIMGAHGKRLDILNYHYARLISCVDDHLYYNLEHYYAVLRALPGGEKNIDNWHKMIGGRIDGHEIPYHATELSKFETLATAGTMLKLGINRKKVFAPVLKDMEKIKTEVESETSRLKDPKEIIFYLNSLTNRRLGFGFPVVNDVFIMMGLGLLTKVLKKKGLHEEQVIDLLKTHEDVESIRPLEHFNSMIKDLDEKFLRAFAECDLSIGFEPYGPIFNKLKKEGWESQVALMEEFLKLYGDRSFEELKLESLPMKNNPKLLEQLIIWSKKNNSVSKVSKKEELKIDLSWGEKKIVNFTRDAIAMREATRLWRGKFYHLFRQLVLNLGRQLQEQDSSWKQFSLLDFFSLSHHEWMKFAKGTLSKEEAQNFIVNRRGWQTKKRHYPELIPWVESEALPGMEIEVSSGSLEGQGVSPGIIEGHALVLDSPEQALKSDYKDFILVTKNTDPAWVYIMSRSLGLISEKGSLLSHTAIIGRELNIPTIVGVKMATQKLRTGDRIRIDALKGTIEIL